jgi:16S rRNA (guanine527-N7)-methyltransferase
VLLDSNGKKTRFLEHVRLALRLANVEVVHDRVETHESPGGFDVILSRAFASLDAMIAACAHLLAPGGIFLAMKGQYPDDELRDVEDRIDLEGVDALAVPGLAEARCLVRMRLRSPAA